MSNTEDNNYVKENLSRPAIATLINTEIKTGKYMFEFLGGGVGAEYYAKTLENLRSIVLCESDKKKRKQWIDSGKHDALPVEKKYIFEDAMDLFHCAGLFNVINLDFCTFFYDNGKDNCTAAIINKVFEKNRITNDGLILFTFQLTGIGVNMYKTALKTKEDIVAAISEIAEKHGYEATKVFSFKYKASRPTTMLNLGFKVKK